ncbi:hypothetical protein [Xylophilus ampelinus]|uniref:Type III secretion protein D n=1 Tax=Xylophilus ampelinus TaxID=54067 RepID=A0A318ST94_9BURK|nr:hypothetical protein [Xylophilus ampelinus]MCS4510422.1 hypothetical protein [Xylophilus ampelinus]PYE77876.1 type III secretion protein D [Xylophilus ampelinus]
MNRLRVLTGRHAGTDLVLQAGRHVISAENDADIRLLDWTGAPLVLNILQGADLVYSAHWSFADAATGEAAIDLVPRRFDDTVLCVGPADACGWPSDLELLGRLLRPVTETSAVTEALQPNATTPVGAPQPARRWLVWGATAGAAVAVVVFVVVVSGVANDAAARVPPLSPVAQTQKAVTAAGLQGLVVRAQADGAMVEGLLATPTEVAQMNAALDALPRGMVMRRYAAATDIAQSIVEALDEPRVSVRHVAGGEFVIEGAAVGVDRLRVAANRIAADLAPLVRTIRVQVTDLPPQPRTPVGAMLESHGITYVQTRDGTKHLSLTQAPVEELKDSDLGLSQNGASDRIDIHSPRSLR